MAPASPASPGMPTRLRRPVAALACGLAAALALAGCAGSASLNAAGASFPASLYQRWFQQLAGQGVKVAYQSVGSGAGVRQFIANTLDFAASDVPMGAKDISQVKRGVVQIPMTAGAIAVAYNLPGCELKLSQAQLADIFLGRITNYSQLGCQARPIALVHRSDGSGTTANFTAHLAAISPAWKTEVGSGKTVRWPTGIGAKGNEGVSAQLKQVQGALGYVEMAYVKAPLQSAALTNASGTQAKPTKEAEQEALAAIDLGPELTGGNPNPAKGYPIVSFSWLLLYKSGNGAKLQPITKALTYTLSDQAQAMAPELGYISLPPEVLAKGRAALATLQP